ncbi:Cytochrome ubiquinol oxidase subunit 1 [Acididesulfobacillus acetoxydans]|uniref:Cytochrome d ubiquinol oxidase subunit 1 n=1 Tax=Acididesulfobacillus acetoxydans TaxID=1561005 RepID=A0A8S0WGT6_9FIRM|nr:cytochrome ubiquinol oxidase subunit I [Acididesulfobacillus acetoxydans]CAA7602182.1 Cytochrome ubiquinol oxidase subunit 1 [Acididesulfobacillus acetoxydans]CEJ08738.1 Cytochrome d ubiquinol oxidase subunit 1 [Acididesulfobacillus acetoxydans]
MSELVLARLQFGITTAYHFLFVPLTLGLSVLVAIMETQYVRTGDETYKKMTQFWGKLFLINFAMGVVTGLVQEFQFGMNWSEYSRFMGDIFGAPLAIEALLAFFIESTFLGVWVFGWDRLPKKVHALTIWLVAIASNLSALWILIANSFMQEPVGYVLRHGRAEMSSFWAVVTNPHVFYQFPHTVLSGFTTAGFFVLGISAYHLLRHKYQDLFRRSFRLAVIFALISILATAAIGHLQGQYLVRTQPMSMAAAEAQWQTENPAAFSVIAAIDQKAENNTMDVKVPGLLSFLSHNSFRGKVTGIKELQAADVQKYGPGNYIPPVAPMFWSFRIMVLIGGWLVLAALLAAWFSWKKGFPEGKTRFLKALVWTVPLPYIANFTGWYMAETGRQPWIVYGLQKTASAVSPSVSAGEVLTTLILFTLVYGVLAVADGFLLLKYIRRGPEETVTDPNGKGMERGASLWT